MKLWIPLASKFSAVALAGSLGIMASALPGVAQEAAPAGETVAVSFPSMQVRQGNAAYQEACASCHGGRLEGMLENPPLSGDEFRAKWWGQPLSSLYEFIASYMPLDRPGNLKPEQYAAITAFIMSKNGIKPTDGAEPLPGDVEKLMNITLPAADVAAAQ
mgnify:FL=1